MKLPLSSAFQHPGLEETKLAGAYLMPALPKKLDANAASREELIKNGLYWQDPTHKDDPAIDDLWRTRYLSPWVKEERITPTFLVKNGKVHRPVVRRLPGHVANEITNWSGGGVFGSWTSASGTWKVPTVSKPAEAPGADGAWDSSSWVGLDGSGSNDVLQAGVEQSVDASGHTSYVAWYEWFCAFQKKTLGDTSPYSPSLAALHGRLYLAWRGDGNQNLNVMVSTDNGQTFSNKIVSPETSSDAPALATDGTNLFIAWKGSNNPNLNVATVLLDATSGAPRALINKVVLGDTSPVRPCLAAFNGNLYLGWKGNGNDHLNVMVSTNRGQSFGGKFTSPETSPHAPCLCAHNGALYIGWKGDGNDNLNLAKVTLSGANPSGTSNKVTLGDTSPVSPTLASLNGILYLGWKGDGNDNLNIMQSTNNGASFGGKYVSPETSPDSPCLVALNNRLFIGWKGDGNDNLNVSVVGVDNERNITGFTTPQYVYEVNITNFAISPGDTVHCTVQYINNKTAGLISFGNQTTGKNFQITLVPPPGADVSGNSAEWVMEVPTIGGSLAHLPKFTPITFTSSFSGGVAGAGNPNTGSTFKILNDAGQALTSTTLGNQSVAISYV